MFDALTRYLNHPSAATESTDADRAARMRVFLASRIERRWAFNKTAPTIARASLERPRASVVRLRKAAGTHPRFDEATFARFSDHKRVVDAKLIRAGLYEIPALGDVFKEIASLPPSTESANLPRFKAHLRTSLKSRAPAYDLSSYRVCARFMVDRALSRQGERLASAGYDAGFLAAVETGVAAMERLITTMEDQAGQIHKLGGDIVDALMGDDAANYRHARRQYELVCTLYSSILTNGPMQYLTQAASTLSSMAPFYR